MDRLLFQITGAFAEFERTMIRQRIHARLKTVKVAIAVNGSFTARNSGIVRKRLGRPGADPKKIEAARRELAKGTGVLKTAKLVGLGTGTVQPLKQQAAVGN
jgi:DNA invertase Pin-like site-specific DNA recombinase